MKLIIIFIAFIAYIYSKELLFSKTDIYVIEAFKGYKLIKDNIYHYFFYSSNYSLNIQCDSYISLLYYDDLSKVNKRFNGSFSDYKEKKIGYKNINFNGLVKDSYFISESNNYCIFYNKEDYYKIDCDNLLKNEYQFEFSDNLLEYPNKIEFIHLYEDKYLYLQYKYMQIQIYRNNDIYNYSKSNEFKKLEKGNNYIIKFEVNSKRNSLIYFKFLDTEINEITYNSLKFKVLNGGIFYFFTKKGFENGGIKTTDKFYTPIYCQKIDNVFNIYDIDYKNILSTSYDCRLSEGNTLLEYPILEKDSYFIFSIEYKIINDDNNKEFSLKLVNNSKNEEKEEKEGQEEQEEKEDENDYSDYYYLLLLFVLIFLYLIIKKKIDQQN